MRIILFIELFVIFSMKMTVFSLVKANKHVYSAHFIVLIVHVNMNNVMV